MRRLSSVLCVVSLLVGACGESTTGDSSPASSPPGSTTSTEAPTSSTNPGTTTSTTHIDSTTVTTSPHHLTWTVETYGKNPTAAFGSRGELGSGCSPGGELLPDGMWFGWIDTQGEDSIAFDLACLWPGRLEPAASNDSSRIRQVPVAPETVVYRGDTSIPYASWDGTESPARNAPGLRGGLPYWLFVNDGLVTEISEYPEPVIWAVSADAWPDLWPGCCDGGPVAPPSPIDPWPETGWPVDGFYSISWAEAPDKRWIEVDTQIGYQVEIGKWIACKAEPGVCPEWWTDDEVTVDEDTGFIERTIPLDRELTVVILPIFSDVSLVGDGESLQALVTDMSEAVARWIDVEPSEEYWSEFAERTEDPSFPFGSPSEPGATEQGPLGYRGPGGTHLTWDAGWLTLEIRNGRPILYIHAGLVAG